MELRSIKEEVKKEYPKMGEVKSKKLKKCIPSKWSKIGITSFVLGLILKNTAYATESIQTDNDVKAVLSGEIATPSPTVGVSRELESFFNMVIVVSIVSIASIIRNYN